MKNDHVSQRRLIYIAIALLCAFVPESAYYTGCPTVSYLMHQFTHANLWHLLANMIALIAVMEIVCHTINPIKTILIGYLFSVVAALLTTTDVATVGCSSMVYFILGIFYAFAVGGKILRIRNRSNFIVGVVIVLLTMLISFFLSRIAVYNHLISIGGGLLYGGLEYMQYSKYYRGE